MMNSNSLRTIPAWNRPPEKCAVFQALQLLVFREKTTQETVVAVHQAEEQAVFSLRETDLYFEALCEIQRSQCV